MDWIKADVQWNRETFEMPEDLPGVLEDVDVAFEGAWLHVRSGDGVRSYPSRLVFRVIWRPSRQVVR